MSRHNCAPDCDYCEGIAEGRASEHLSASDEDYLADRAEDRETRWMEGL